MLWGGGGGGLGKVGWGGKGRWVGWEDDLLSCFLNIVEH